VRVTRLEQVKTLLCIMEPLHKSLSRLIQLLDLPDADYWYDIASCDARAIVDQGGGQLLQEIATSLTSWPSLRQQHLAYILGESNAVLEV
jgi:hypothetical protein